MSIDTVDCRAGNSELGLVRRLCGLSSWMELAPCDVSLGIQMFALAFLRTGEHCAVIVAEDTLLLIRDLHPWIGGTDTMVASRSAQCSSRAQRIRPLSVRSIDAVECMEFDADNHTWLSILFWQEGSWLATHHTRETAV